MVTNRWYGHNYHIKLNLYDSHFNHPSMCEVVQHPNFTYRQHIAAFDYDHTIVKPKSNSTFSKNVEDWMWLRPNVVTILRSLYEDGYSIVVFTNQYQPFKQVQIKIALDTLEVPYKVYIMMDKAIKKPNPECFQKHIIGQTMSPQSFYVGDALGRVQDWSDVDKVFAINNNIKYISPEEMFPFTEKQTIIVKPVANKEVIIMVGYQGSGKSTFVKTHFSDKYSILRGDVLKTEAKMSKHLRAELTEGNSVVIDATNSGIIKRAVFIKIAKDKGATVRIVHIATTIEESMVNNAKRDKPIPNIALYMFRAHYNPPTLLEGVEEIITVS